MPLSSDLKFLRGFIAHPKRVSSFVSTSKRAVDDIVGRIDGSVRKVIMEYGPGMGPVSKALLEPNKLTPDSKLILVEIEPLYVRHLKRTINDPRVTIVHDSAARADEILHECGEEKVDHVLLSIPLSQMAQETRSHILNVSRDILDDDGSLIAFLFHHATAGYIRDAFGNVSVKRIWRNIPPLKVMEAKKIIPGDEVSPGIGVIGETAALH